MKKINEDIKSNSFKSVYLFYGEEAYLKQEYEKRLKKAICKDNDMNLDVFEGKSIIIDHILDAAETLPFLAERRLILVRESSLFVSGRKDDSEKMAVFTADIPETTIMLFVESNIDKRSRLYKRVTERGRAVEFKTPSEGELVLWLTRIFKSKEKTISKPMAYLLLQTVGSSMDLLYREAHKLIDYIGQEVTGEDIEAVCTRSLESKIFDLTDAVGRGRLTDALDIFGNLLVMKEQPMMVLSMLARQFRMILQCKELSQKGLSQEETAAALGIRGFMVSKYVEQGRNFSREKLIKSLKACLDADMKIKTGGMGDKLAVEMLIIEYTGE